MYTFRILPFPAMISLLIFFSPGLFTNNLNAMREGGVVLVLLQGNTIKYMKASHGGREYKFAQKCVM